MKSFWRLLLLVGVMALAVSGWVNAQTNTPVFCGDLAEADCTLLKDAQAAALTLESSSFTLDATMAISGIPDMGDGSMTFKLTGSGAVTTDRSAMPDMTSIKPEDMATNPMAVFKLLGEAIPAMAANLQFGLTLPEAVLAEMSSDMKLPETLNLSLKLVDGNIYVNVEELAAYIPNMKGAKGWMGINLPDLLTAVMEQPEFAESMGAMGDMSVTGINAEMFSSFSDPETLGTFMSMQRVDDSTIDGQPVAVFEMVLDYEALFASPLMQEMMAAQQKAMGNTMSEKEMEQMMSMLQMMGKGITLTMQQYIDLETKQQPGMDMQMRFDMSSLMSSMGGSSSDAAQPVIAFDLSMRQSDFNAVEPITVPEGALVLPVETFMPQAAR